MNKYSPYPGDIVDAKLEPGEFVLNRNAVKAIGVNKLKKINDDIAPRFDDENDAIVAQNKIKLGMAREMQKGSLVVRDAQALRNERNMEPEEGNWDSYLQGMNLVQEGLKNSGIVSSADRAKKLIKSFIPTKDFNKEGPLTPAEQVFVQARNNVTNLNLNNPAIAKVLKDNPYLANYIDTKKQELRLEADAYGPNQKSEKQIQEEVNVSDDIKQRMAQLNLARDAEKYQSMFGDYMPGGEKEKDFYNRSIEVGKQGWADFKARNKAELEQKKKAREERILKHHKAEMKAMKAKDKALQKAKKLERKARQKEANKKAMKSSFDKSKEFWANYQDGGEVKQKYSIGVRDVDAYMKGQLKRIQLDKQTRDLLRRRVPAESYDAHIKVREKDGSLMTNEEKQKVLQYFMQKNKAKQNYQEGDLVQKKTLKDMVEPYLPKKDDMLPYLEILTGASAKTEDYKPGALDAALAIPVVGGVGKGVFKGLRKFFKPNKVIDAGEQILKEGSSKAVRATKLPEKFAKVGNRTVGVAEFADDAGNTIRQPMYKSTGTSGHGGFRAGQWMPFLGRRGPHFHKGRFALGKGGKPVSHMAQQDKYGNIQGLSPRMKKYLSNADKFDWEVRMTGPTGPDTGRMKQLSYDIKQLENKIGDLPAEEVDWNNLNKWLTKEGVEIPGENWVPKGYQQGGMVSSNSTGGTMQGVATQGSRRLLNMAKKKRGYYV